jgi:glycosyltransferase involved in cell wall biosynthesis
MTSGPSRCDPGAAGIPAISVVTPCLNSAATLQQTLDSVRAQDYPGVEHIIVDAGSRDGTLDILAAAPGIHYISEPDRGLSDGLNKGIRMSHGDLVGWLNADDVYLRGALDAVSRAYQEHPDALWITGPCIIIGADGREIRRGATAYKNFLLHRYSFSLYLTQNFISSPATFMTRAGLKQVGLFDIDLKYSMDYDVWLRLARLADPVIADRPLAAFRMHEGSLSMSGFQEAFAEHARVARHHGAGHAIPVRVNTAMSRLIVAVYRVLALVRRVRRPRRQAGPAD